MIRFISGNAGCGKSTYITERIRERISTEKKIYLIVPEQEVVLREAEMCKKMPASAALSLEVVSFKRLANTVARKEGGLTYNFAGEGKKSLLMWSAITSVLDSLEVYGNDKGREDTYVKLMLDTVKELKMNGVTPEKLEEAYTKIEGESTSGLKSRLHDLSLIYASYSHLKENDDSEDPDDVISKLCDTLDTSDFFEGTSVFIDSFYSLTKDECEIVKKIMKKASDVFITFTLSDDPDDIQFKHIRKYYGDLLRFVPKNADFDRIFLKENHRTDKKSLISVCDNLWRFSKIGEENDGSVKVISCKDKYEEARAVGALIEKYIHEGSSYSEIAVITRSVDKFRGILDSRLDSLKIPYHLSKRYNITLHPAVKLVTSLLRTVSTGFSRDAVISCLKTGLCNIDEFECASFEEYTATWNIRGARAYLSDDAWSMNPNGFTVRTNKWSDKMLSDANKVKSHLAKPLSQVRDAFASGGKVSDVATALFHVFEDLDVYSALENQSSELLACGRYEESEVCKKVYGLIMDSLDLMVSVIPDVTVDPARFSRLFLTVASSFDTGSIPSGFDVVNIGSADGIRCNEVRHVILIGCNEGEFPKSVDNTGFFSDFDKGILEECGILLSENTNELTGEELFRFWRCASLPCDTLDVTFSQSDGGKAASPSIGVKRICSLLKITPESYGNFARYNSVWSAESAADRAYVTDSFAEYKAIKSLSEKYPEIGPVRCYTGSLCAAKEKVSSESIAEYREKLHGGKIPLTQSRLDSFSNCRFAYYMKYTVKLEEQKKAQVGAIDVGNMIHKILELFFFETRNRDFPLEKAETEEITDRIIGKYISDIMNGCEASPKQQYLFSRLRRTVLLMIESLMEEFAQSDFRPYKFELEIGFNSPNKPLPLEFRAQDGTPAFLFGTVDRLDTYTKDGTVYVRVVDYKTGKKEFNISDIKKGLNLQLLVYLFTLWKGDDCAFRREMTPSGEKIAPAGMLYFSAAPDNFKSNSYLSTDAAKKEAKKKISRNGLLLSDDDILRAMDKKSEGEYIPNPSTKPKNPEKRVFRTVEEFDELYETCKSVIEEMLNEMNEGECYASPDTDPYSSTCKYCAFKPVCRFDFTKEADDNDE